MIRLTFFSIFFFFNDTATTEIYTLSLHDALPILADQGSPETRMNINPGTYSAKLISEGKEVIVKIIVQQDRSEEHTSELQSQSNLVCRLLLEKKKKK